MFSHLQERCSTLDWGFLFLSCSASIRPHALSIWFGGWWLCPNICRWSLHWVQSKKFWNKSSIPFFPWASNILSICKHQSSYCSLYALCYCMLSSLLPYLLLNSRLDEPLKHWQLQSQQDAHFKNLLTPISLTLFVAPTSLNLVLQFWTNLEAVIKATSYKVNKISTLNISEKAIIWCFNGSFSVGQSPNEG